MSSLTMFLRRYFREFTEFIEGFTNSIERDIESRLDDLWVYRREVDYENILFSGEQVFKVIDSSRIPCKPVHFIGVDGSSRAVDTPYAFIGVASLSIYSNYYRELLDHPPLPISYPLKPVNAPFIALSPDIPVDKEFIKRLMETPYVTLYSPAGTLYSRDYNKSVILDELRNSLENKGLERISDSVDVLDRMGKPIVIVDGPVYPVPNILKQHYNLLMLRVKRGRLDDYVASWRIMLSERIEFIKSIERNGIPVLGVVKRLESSRLIVSCKSFLEAVSSEYGVCIGDTGNDQAFIDTLLRILVSRRHLSQPYNPVVIGPFHVSAKATFVDKYVDTSVPDKTAYYVVVPKYRFGGFMRYIVYRVEATNYSSRLVREAYGMEVYDAVLRDSIGSGTLLPLTILYADKRCKKLSRSLARVIAGDLESKGIPLTYDTIRIVEAHLYE